MDPHRFPKAVTAALVTALCTGVAFAASDFVGKYKTTDTLGKEMTITLAEDGSATGQRMDESSEGYLEGRGRRRSDHLGGEWLDHQAHQGRRQVRLGRLQRR